MHRVHHGNVPPPPPHPSLAAAAAVRTHLPFAKCPDSVYLIMSTKDGMVIFDCPGRDPYGMKFLCEKPGVLIAICRPGRWEAKRMRMKMNLFVWKVVGRSSLHFKSIKTAQSCRDSDCSIQSRLLYKRNFPKQVDHYDV
ncbi:Uncharacterized protein TCM_042239 [Theobroma cacao]|uniref:Uncharacterized protein n=1 Tax=Theobroma cacao TaxID=3641 RepID=A0A061GXP6_THECC|nr:Uncharacterized protein TCM_042239 [Theobroma cacao]